MCGIYIYVHVCAYMWSPEVNVGCPVLCIFLVVLILNIIVSPCSFLFPNLPIYPFLSFKSMTYFYFDCCCTCIYVCIIHIKYNFLSMYSITYMYVSKADDSVLDNQLVFPSLEKTISPTFSTLKLLLILHVGLRVPELFPIHVSMPIYAALVQIMFRKFES